MRIFCPKAYDSHEMTKIFSENIKMSSAGVVTCPLRGNLWLLIVGYIST